MARTPLFARVRRWAAAGPEEPARVRRWAAGPEEPARVRRWAAGAEEPVRVRCAAASAGDPPKAPSRRDAMRLLGGGALALGACRAPDLPAQSAAARAPRIVIVGAGAAGLSAARFLLDEGLRSTVYEAARDVGGRMRSDAITWGDGSVTEWCGELIDTRHTALAALAQRFGLTLDNVRAGEPEEPDAITYHVLGAPYPLADIDRDFAALRRVLEDQNTRAPFPTTYAKHTPDARALDAMSVSSWIDRYVEGGRRGRLGTLLDIAYTAEYGRDTGEQSSLNLVYLLLGSAPGFTPFGDSDERFRIRGGNQELPRAIAASLPAGSVRTGHRLTSVAAGAKSGVSLRFETEAGTREVEADLALLTVPFGVLRRIDTSRAGFDVRKRTAIAELGYGTNAKLHVQFRERFWRAPGGGAAPSSGTTFSDSGYQSTWESTRAQSGRPVLVNFVGGAEGRAWEGDTPYGAAPLPHVVAASERFVRRLEPVLPGGAAQATGRASLSTPAADPNLRGSYACWLVGQYTRFAGYEGAAQGPIHFAGEHCSLLYQGFMEGAVVEGQRAAGEIVARVRAKSMGT